MLTPEDRKNLAELAALLRSATPGITYTVEEKDDDDWPSHQVGLFRLESKGIIGSLKPEYASDGELFSVARDELVWLLKLVKRLSDEDK